MGDKGLQITIALAVAATFMLLIGLALDFQRVAFSIYGVPSAHIIVHLRTAEFRSFVGQILKDIFQTAEERDKFQQFNRTPVHDLQDVKDIFCGLNGGFRYFGEVIMLCEQFNTNYYGGLVLSIVSVAVVVMEGVACGYLAYYWSGRTKKEYRQIAMLLFAIAPCAEMTALLMYCICIALTARSAGGVLSPRVTWTPGVGLIVTLFASIVFFIIPCLRKQWKLDQNEFLNEERLMHKQRVEERLMDDIFKVGPNLPPSFSYDCGFPQDSDPSRRSIGGDRYSYPPEAATWYNNHYSTRSFDHLTPSVVEIPRYDPHMTPSVAEIPAPLPYDQGFFAPQHQHLYGGTRL